MARRGATPPPPTSALALIATGEAIPALPNIGQELGGTIEERLEAMRPGGTALDSLQFSSDTHNLGPQLDPLSIDYPCLTHPVTGTEPFRPYLSEKTMLEIAKRGGPKDPRMGIMGRVLDIDVENFKAGLGAPDARSEQWSLIDEHWVSGWVGMTLDAAEAADNGLISPFVPLLMNPQRDAYMVWRRDMNERRYDGERGEWILNSVVSSTDPHPEDAMVWYYDFDKRDPKSNIKIRFLDPLSIVATPQEAERDSALVDKLLGKGGQGRDFETYISALARSTFRSDYDPDNDNIPRYVRDEVKRVSKLLDLNDVSGPMGLTDFWRTIVPAGLAKMVGRTVQMLDELKEYRRHSAGADPKKINQDEAINRRQIAESFVAAVRYYSIIHKLFTKLPGQYQAEFYERNVLGTDVPPFEQPMLLDMMVVDDLDRTTLNPGKLAGVISNHRYPASNAGKNTTQAVDRIKRRVNNPNANDFRFIVRTYAPEGLRSFSDLDRERREYSTGNAIISNGLNDLEAGSLGAVYPDEILRSLVDPIEEDGPPESQRFGLGGLAMLGVVAMIEIDTKSGTEAFLITSAKRQPHGLNRAVLGQYHARDRDHADIARMVTGQRTGLTRILAAEHQQRWRMVGVSGNRPQDVVAKSPRLANGDTFTIAVDEKGEAKSTSRIIGSVKGERTRTRRIPTTLTPQPIKPTKVTTRDLSRPAARPGKKADTEIIFANNRVYATDGKRKETRGHVSLYKRTIAQQRKGKR